MNSDISQCKSCWKWEYTMYIYSSKYNSSHKLKHHREMAQYCKTNFKINSPKLKTKKEKPYTYSFKYINCKNKHQMNSNICSF